MSADLGRSESQEAALRAQRSVAAKSVATAFFLTGSKLAVGLFTGSLGVLSEAAHSGLDLVAAGMTWLSVHLSAKPADVDHHYGHHKIDNFSALFETLLLLVTCVWIIWEAVQRLFYRPVAVEVNAWSFGVIVLAIVLDYGRSRSLLRVARETRSSALEADALHFSSDIGSSSVVLLGLLFTKLGYPQADSIGALGVALLVIWIAVRLGKKAIDALLDRAPAGHAERAAAAALAVTGVRNVRDVRVRHAGPRHFVDLKVLIDPATSTASAHGLAEQVESEVARRLSNADVVVHVEPDLRRVPDLGEAVFALAEGLGARAHALELHRTPSGLEAEVHLEWPLHFTLAEAHDRASRFEEELRAHFPNVAAVRTHLEASGVYETQTSRDVTESESALVRAVYDRAAAVAGVLRVESVRLLEKRGRLWVSLACWLDPRVELPEADRITTRVEMAVTALDPRIADVRVHAEPAESIF